MTYSDDLRNSQIDGDQEPDYPQAFGITFTPMVTGIIFGVIGIVSGGYMLMNMIMPTIEVNKQLKMDQQEKQAQLNRLESGEISQKIQELEAKIAKVKTLEPQILALFSDETTLHTLLLDINRFIDASDAELISYQPQDSEASIITDSSLGELVNNKLKRKSIDLEIQGNFADIQSILQDIERLQPLLLINDFNTTVSEKPTYLFNQGQITPQGEAQLKTTFRMDAILPLTSQEFAATQPAGEEDADK